MGQDPSTAGAQVGEKPREPQEIRRDIESTRREMGDTVEALAGKADVKTQLTHKLRENPAPFALAGALVAGLIAWRVLKR
jgi:Protein of unknown function (DUF3618)